MKKAKKLFLILYAPVLVLLISIVLSQNTDFNWSGIFVFIGIVICTQLILCLKKSPQLAELAPGWLISGTLWAFLSAKGMCGVYENIFEFMALITFAANYFFIFIPVIQKKQKP